jgi:hypothetical protein
MKNKRMTMIAAVLAFASSLLADEKPAAKDPDTHKIEGQVVMPAGQKMPDKVSFAEVRDPKDPTPTHPISIPLKDGHFEVDLIKVPKGYVLTTYPCSKPEKILLNGEDILAKQDAAAGQTGAGGIARNLGVLAGGLAIGGGFADAAAAMLGGVKFSDCGSQ